MVTHMVSVGEETGQLEQMLAKIADFYEAEVDAKVKALTSMIEPVMIIFVGGVVGFIVISMYLPIFSIYEQDPLSALASLWTSVSSRCLVARRRLLNFWVPRALIFRTPIARKSQLSGFPSGLKAGRKVADEGETRNAMPRSRSG